MRRWVLFVAMALACDGSSTHSPSSPSPAEPSEPAEPADEPDEKRGGVAAKLGEMTLPEAKLIEPLGDPPPAPDAPKVVLPPSPSFDTTAVPDRDAEGHWSVAGLRNDRKVQLGRGEAGTEIMLKAWVQEIYVPPVCPEGEFCPPAKQPHLWVVDRPDTKGKKQAMMVVNYSFVIPEWDQKPWEGVEEVELKAGEQYVIKGKFKRFSDTGFASEDGLFEFIAVQRSDAKGATRWVYPPGAAWHPVSIAIMEKQNAELAERARKAAARAKRRGR